MLVCGLLFGGWTASSDAQTTLYRWVDERGEVHYTDQVPPGQVKQGHTKLSPEGIRTETIPPEPTAEERRLAAEQARLQADAAQRLVQQQADDRLLLQRYRTLDDLILTREGRIAAIEALSQVQRDGIRVQQERLLTLHAQKKKLIDSGQPVPDELTQDSDKAGRLIRDGYAAIVKQAAQKLAIHDEFDGIIARFSRLKRLPLPPPADPATERGPGNLVSCEGSAPCAALWERALEYVRRDAGTQDEILGTGLLIAFQTDDREQRRLTLTWIQPSATQPVHLYLDLQCKNRQTGSQVCIEQRAVALRDGFRAAMSQPPDAVIPPPEPTH